MAHFFSNREIARLLRGIAAAYEAKGEDRFKIIAYDNAATSVEHATSELKDLWEDKNLDSIPGLGKSIQAHLDELFKTGRVKHFETVKENLPPGMFALLDVPGLGPKTAYKLAKNLNIKSVEDLEKAAAGGKIRELEGFGQKSEEEILSAIAELKARTTRYLLPFAFATAERVLTHLRKLEKCQRAEPLGSLRRMSATVGDVDIAACSNSPRAVIDHFKKFSAISRVLEAGERKATVLLKNGMQVDLMTSSPEAFGALLQHFTGSKNHNIHLREYALKKGWSVSDYGIKVGNKTKEFKTEQEFYRFLGMDYIEPELREDAGEIEAALVHKLPKLVAPEDMKGDIHLHSNYPIEPSHDLGTGNFEEIIEKAKSLNYEYVGLSDHSPGYSTHTKNQIIEIIKKRTARIDQLKSSSKNIKVLNLLEIDILNTGELSVPEEGLKILDGTIAGIHSSHRQDKKTMTKRILGAANSPYVQVIAHPTGRIIQQRESYEVDWPKVFEACVKTKTVLEINAWPSRLDLADILVREAISANVKLIINTDAHQIEQMDNMKFGVAVARRGWAEKEDVINTLPWERFKTYFNVKST